MNNLLKVIPIAFSVFACSGSSGSNDQPANSEEVTSDDDVTSEDVVSENVSVPNQPFVVESQVAGDFDGLEYGKVIELRNGQLWEQTSSETSTTAKLSPDAFILSSAGKHLLYVEGMKIVRVHPLTDVLNYQPVDFIEEDIVTSDFNGWDQGNMFTLQFNGTWRQTSYLYEYRYEYRPTVYVFGIPFDYKMLSPSMNSVVSVEKLD